MDTKLIKVLLIEDDEDDYCLVRDILSDIKGWQYDLEWVNTHDAGLPAICRNEHDVCLLDYRLGESTGLDLLRETAHRSCRIPIVLLTGEGGHDVDVEAMNAGAADFLTKGKIDADGLERSIRHAIARRRAEADLLESEERHRAITECAQDAIITSDAEGIIRLWNPAAERIFGYTAMEVVGKNLLELIVPPQYQDAHRKGLTAFAGTGRGNAVGKTVELTALRKDRTEFPVELSVTAYQESEGFLAVALVRDITERKKMEERLRHSQKMEAIGSLVAGVAHDYNNQLQAVLASLEMALEDLAPDSPTYVAVDVAERAARRSLEITKGLLGYTRGESETHVLVDLGRLLWEAGQVLQRVLPANIRFKFSGDESLWPIMGNATQIQQVLMNLVVNARDAMPSGGLLTIAAVNRTMDTPGEPSRPNRVVLISISDTGVGMAPEIVSRIFDPFFTTKERGHGTGLGLSLTHGIIKNHGGWIEVRSAVGEGTTFDISLPAVESAECERRPPESTVCAASSPLSALFNNQETHDSEE